MFSFFFKAETTFFLFLNETAMATLTLLLFDVFFLDFLSESICT
jgi:hypothetical protein